MRTIAVDAHVLTGFPQGSRTYLENVLRCIGKLDKTNRYQIFSFEPETTRRAFGFANFEHHKIGLSAAMPRLLLYWPYAKLRFKFDVLITQYILPPLVPGPHFVVIHDILPETHPQLFPPFMRRRSRILFRMSARLAREVFVVSQYTRREVIGRYKISPDKVHLTYNGFDAAAFERTSLADRRPGRENYILYVGRLEPRKNVDVIIEALAGARVPGLRLVIVGRVDSAAPSLLEMIKTAPGVEHLTRVEDRELDRLYRGARALIYPSSAEGFGLPILEALARRVPVIASDRTALPEIGGVFARYFNPTLADASVRLAALLQEVCALPTPPPMPGLGAHLAKFDWERSARTIIERIDLLP
ncbi:MAG: glycosyltransferase family 1 protein [Rhodospirillales bacterium]|nr:glycosyltransferase family 1 protein [Rhodospirillales bacterium]